MTQHDRQEVASFHILCTLETAVDTLYPRWDVSTIEIAAGQLNRNTNLFWFSLKILLVAAEIRRFTIDPMA
jgi:hypothetical protein